MNLLTNENNEKETKFDGTLVTLVDEDGNDLEFEHLDTVEIGDKTYVALVPVYEDGEEYLDADGELVLLNVTTDEKGDEVLLAIENEEEFDRVAKVFEERLSEEFDIQSDDSKPKDEATGKSKPKGK